jgi:hypothetical protein
MYEQARETTSLYLLTTSVLRVLRDRCEAKHSDLQPHDKTNPVTVSAKRSGARSDFCSNRSNTSVWALCLTVSPCDPAYLQC